MQNRYPPWRPPYLTYSLASAPKTINSPKKRGPRYRCTACRACSARAVLVFLGYGGALTTLGAFVGGRPQTSPLILIASMGTIAVVEIVLTQGWLWIRETVREHEARLRGLTNSLPGVVFQFFVREDGTVGHHFVSEHAEDVLGVEADPAPFHERYMNCIPEPHRREIEQSIEVAIDEQSD